MAKTRNSTSPFPRGNDMIERLHSPFPRGNRMIERLHSPFPRGNRMIERLHSPFPRGNGMIERLHSPFPRGNGMIERLDSQFPGITLLCEIVMTNGNNQRIQEWSQAIMPLEPIGGSHVRTCVIVT